MKRIVSRMMLTLLIVGMLVFTFDIQRVKANEYVYIRADGSIDPHTANITTIDNITYTFTDGFRPEGQGSGYCYIVVEKDDIIINGAGYYMEGPAGGTGIDLSYRSNVTVRNIHPLNNYEYGIRLYYSSNIRIVDNYIEGNGDGIYLHHSSNNSIHGNDFQGCGCGVAVYHSSNNNISENQLSWCEGIGGVYLLNSSNNWISENTMIYCSDGIYLDQSSKNNIFGNSIKYYKGIHLENSWNNSISGNDIVSFQEGHGLPKCKSIDLIQSSNNTICGNSFRTEEEVCFGVGQSNNNVISKNNITGQGWICLSLGSSLGNIIVGNNIKSGNWGIKISSSSNNSIYHNSLANTYNVETSGSINIWDDGYPSGGNYWSDYAEVDSYSGYYQNETGSDGIGDVPYAIDANNTDHYPLTQPYHGPVRNLNTGQSYSTIQEGVNNATDGDRILALSGIYHENVVVNKTLTMEGENRDTTIIDGSSSGHIMEIFADNVCISRFTFQNSGWDYNAIWVRNPFSGVTVRNNTMIDNRCGVAVESGAFNVRILANVIFNRQPSYADGIRLFSSGTLVVGNIVMNESTGIGLDWASDNVIRNNTVVNNYIGIGAGSPSYNNTFSENIIINNNYGFLIAIYDSEFFHNSIINNTVQVAFYGSVYSNIWDNDYPCGGNYWSNYNDTDLYSGAFQNETGSDGIGDTSYIIDENNIDHYPLTKPYGGLYDVGITNIITSKAVVGQGYDLSITIETLNYGVNIETFNITVYANTTIIYSLENITLTSRNSTIVTFTWNTTDFVKGNYTISAYLTPIEGETDTSDNHFTDDWVFVTIAGDVTSVTGPPDGTVDMRDIGAICNKFMTAPSHPDWNPNYDINGDGVVNMRDISIACDNFMKTFE